MHFVSLKSCSLDNHTSSVLLRRFSCCAISLQLVRARIAHHDAIKSISHQSNQCYQISKVVHAHRCTPGVLRNLPGSQIYDPISCQCSSIAALSDTPWQATEGVNVAKFRCPASHFNDRAPIVQTSTIAPAHVHNMVIRPAMHA